jgi:serine/threonine-protein kinase RsbT
VTQATEEVRVPITTDDDIVTARQEGRRLSSVLGFSSTDLTLIATAISEVARNITTYATRGEVLLSVVRDDNGRAGIQVIARDEGPGIENLELALQDGYTSGGGLGLGLPGARRLVDDFHIETAPGQGTKVTLVMWARSNSRAA